MRFATISLKIIIKFFSSWLKEFDRRHSDTAEPDPDKLPVFSGPIGTPFLADAVRRLSRFGQRFNELEKAYYGTATQLTRKVETANEDR